MRRKAEGDLSSELPLRPASLRVARSCCALATASLFSPRVQLPRPRLSSSAPARAREEEAAVTADGVGRSHTRRAVTDPHPVDSKIEPGAPRGDRHEIGHSAYSHRPSRGVPLVCGRKRGSAMPPSNLRDWFEPDECDVCPPCGERGVVATHEARHCLACGCIWLRDADGGWKLAVSSLHALTPVLRTRAAPPPDGQSPVQPRLSRRRRGSPRRLAAGTVARSTPENAPS